MKDQSAEVTGEEMTREEAVARGMFVFTKAEVAHLRGLTGAKRQAFIALKLSEHRVQQKAKFAVDMKALQETHPLGCLDEEDRRKERNRLKRRRRNRAGR